MDTSAINGERVDILYLLIVPCTTALLLVRIKKLKDNLELSHIEAETMCYRTVKIHKHGAIL